MNTVAVLEPPVSEFESVQEEDDYNAWLRADIAARLADPGPLIPHDEVMAEIDGMIDEIEQTGHSSLIF